MYFVETEFYIYCIYVCNFSLCFTNFYSIMNEGLCRDQADNLPRVDPMMLAIGDVIQNKYRVYTTAKIQRKKVENLIFLQF